jgi:1-phosphofructokinase family hexose kinase
VILTVTLNAAVDKTYRIPGFALDRVHRPEEARTAAGGKGVNVARVVRTLGGEATATGFLGGHNGRTIAAAMADEGIPAEFVATRDGSRQCIAIIDPETHSQTEVNEAGPTVAADECEALVHKAGELLASGRFGYVTLSGSAPPGVPDTIYADLIRLAHRHGVRAVLDASGEPLRQGLEARPWMVKPNLFELASITGSLAETEAEAAAAARSLRGTAAEVVCVTRGRASVVCAHPEGVDAADPPEVEFVSAVGSGDSFLAAFLWSVVEGRDWAEALRLGVAAGAANAARYGSGFCTRAEVLSLSGRVEVRHLSDEG